MLFNLISNSIRYSKAEGAVRVVVTAADRQVSVLVADEGIGIPESELPFIFDSFYRANSHRPEDPGGTGLGLAIVTKLLALHGSVPLAKSVENQGTEISFELPTDSDAISLH